MRRETKTVWMSDDGKTELMIRNRSGTYQVSHVFGLSPELLQELHEAIGDALKTEEAVKGAMAA